MQECKAGSVSAWCQHNNSVKEPLLDGAKVTPMIVSLIVQQCLMQFGQNMRDLLG